MLALAPQPHSITSAHPQISPFAWLDYFDPYAALDAIKTYVETLPSSRRDRHTMRSYMVGFAHYASYMGAHVTHLGGEHYTHDFSEMHMPTKPAHQGYIAHCQSQGLKAATISRNLAVLRHFASALDEQPVTPSTGTEFFIITEMMRQFRLSATVKAPAAAEKSTRGALHYHGTRLKQKDVNQLFESFEEGESNITTLKGKRDFCLIYLGITTALRASELARITLNSITEEEDTRVITVLGKRGNVDPVPLDDHAWAAINIYVAAWNDRLTTDDPRYIHADTPIFWRMRPYDHIPPLHMAAPLPARAILKVVADRTEQALGKHIAAHDLRRTCAALMQSAGFPLKLIQRVLRHSSSATTDRYIGQIENLGQARLTNRVTFHIPVDRSQRLPGEIGGHPTA